MNEHQTSPVYAERLFPSPAFWAGAALLAVVVFVAFLPVDLGLAASVSALVLVAGSSALLIASPRILITDGSLTAGRATIPLDRLGTAVSLDRGALREAMGPGLDARAYASFRPWASSAIRVTVEDPEDPTPYWIVSTRRPEELVNALQR